MGRTVTLGRDPDVRGVCPSPRGRDQDSPRRTPPRGLYCQLTGLTSESWSARKQSWVSASPPTVPLPAGPPPRRESDDAHGGREACTARFLAARPAPWSYPSNHLSCPVENHSSLGLLAQSPVSHGREEVASRGCSPSSVSSDWMHPFQSPAGYRTHPSDCREYSSSGLSSRAFRATPAPCCAR